MRKSHRGGAFHLWSARVGDVGVRESRALPSRNALSSCVSPSRCQLHVRLSPHPSAPCRPDRRERISDLVLTRGRGTPDLASIGAALEAAAGATPRERRHSGRVLEQRRCASDAAGPESAVEAEPLSTVHSLQLHHMKVFAE